MYTEVSERRAVVDDAGDINHPIIKTERKHSKAAERVQKSFDRLLVLILTNVVSEQYM